MGEMKKYTDIIRLGHKSTQDVLKEGDYISITEKIDGANASFTLDENGQVICFSRNTKLDENNTLKGFYNWVQANIVPIKYMLSKDIIYFGEWLCPHTVKYRPDAYNNFYLFSLWYVRDEAYAHDDVVKLMAKKLELKTPHYFYEGEYQSFEHLMSFVGQSVLTEEGGKGEGIVVKNVDYKNNQGNQVFVKLVCPEFAEVQKQRLPKNPNVVTQEQEVVKSVVTNARVEKILNKLVDEGLINEEYTVKDMGIILKMVIPKIIEDVYKEEKELLANYEEEIVKKAISKMIPALVKEIVINK